MVIFLINLALSVESNDSTITGLKRNEYITVIRGIMSTPVTNSYGFSNLKPNDDRLDTSNGRQDMKHDSFYYLQKTMEKRQVQTERQKILMLQKKK